MPSTDQILASLGALSREWRWLAVSWHIIFAVLAAAIVFGWRPSRRAAAILLLMPVATSSAISAIAGSPFTAASLGSAAGAALAVALRLPEDEPAPAGPSMAAFGACLTAFGLIYPHFLPGASMLEYAYSAPVGIAPCPTLSVVIGVSLAFRGFGSRTWSLILGAVGAFYGIFGALRLGVTIDWALAAGSLLLTVVTRETMSRHAGPQVRSEFG